MTSGAICGHRLHNIHRIISILTLFIPKGIYPWDFLFIYFFLLFYEHQMCFMLTFFPLLVLVIFHEDWSGATMFSSPLIRKHFIMPLLCAADP